MNRSKSDKKAKIIAVAIETIHKHGVRKTTLEDIAIASGMANASLYYYFQNKTDIVRAALDVLMNNAFYDIDAIIKSQSTVEEKLDAAVKSVILRFSSSGILTDMNKSTRSEMLVMANEFSEKFAHRYKALLRNILSKGVQDGVFYVRDIELTASVLSSAVFGYLMNAVNVDSVQLSEVWVNEVGKLLMYGLKKR
jgi:AcrR family transcriptional regulator